MQKWQGKHKRIKKDYQRKDLKNPFFRKKEKKKNVGLKKYFLILIVAALIALIWFFLASSFWRLKNIEVEGLTRFDASELRNIISAREEGHRWLLFKESNFFLFQEDEAKTEILAKYNFADLQITKKIPSTIKLKISERPYSFIFQEGSAYFYAASDGYVIKEIPINPEDFGKYFVLENKSDSVTINEQNKITLKDDYLKFVQNLNQILSTHQDLPVEKFIIDQELNSIIVKFKNGPSAYFSVKDDAAEQVEYLALVKKEKIGDNFSKTNYIDLRYGARIFIN
jgi:cell division septal protein FtsQ